MTSPVPVSSVIRGPCPGASRSRSGALFIPRSFGTPSGKRPDSRERAPRPDVVRQPLLKVHAPLVTLLLGLRVRLATAPVHAVLVGTVVPSGPRHDDAGAFGQGLDLSCRERRIGRLRCNHSSSSVTWHDHRLPSSAVVRFALIRSCALQLCRSVASGWLTLRTRVRISAIVISRIGAS